MKDNYTTFAVEDLLNALFEQGSDCSLLDTYEAAAEAADAINGATSLRALSPEDAEWEEANAKLDGAARGTIYTFINGNAGSVVLAGDWD